MTEKEKMLAQKLYDANYDKDLEADRLSCKSLCQQYNALPMQDLAARHEFIKKFWAKPGPMFILSLIFGAIMAITLQ